MGRCAISSQSAGMLQIYLLPFKVAVFDDKMASRAARHSYKSTTKRASQPLDRHWTQNLDHILQQLNHNETEFGEASDSESEDGESESETPFEASGSPGEIPQGAYKSKTQPLTSFLSPSGMYCLSLKLLR